MANLNPVVIDGDQIKLRLQAERTAHKTPVHVDWVRFTALLRSVTPDFLTRKGPVLPSAETLGVRSIQSVNRFIQTAKKKGSPAEFDSERIHRMIRCSLEAYEKEHESPAFKWASSQALELAKEVVQALGEEFEVSPEIKGGKDFYKYSFIIERKGHPCGWVGFMAGSNSHSAEAQNQTLHVNLDGHACTFAEHGWTDRIADLIDKHEAKVTRADLALDLFHGGIDMDALADDYRAGAFDVRGRRPAPDVAGDWVNGRARSFYVGARKSGKVTNIYEKGDQLYGAGEKSDWIRVELRYGDQNRVLPSDIFRRPADFFAGASDWHQLQIVKADSLVTPQKVAVNKALPLQTVKAEIARNLRWAFNAAAPTISAAFKYLSEADFLELCDWRNHKLPGRLRKFSESDLLSAFSISTGSGCAGHALLAT
ncbi:replication initiation factor domain-containing protein [Rhodoferax sp.]|uniref:replication initiation factor domain-containing protein n=1 Tax=Rhodoferax sp. TaxID=50421 RepID=UPI0025E83706|nr:replication initiation factor domain-containing protein [Rhodoferax sp.]